VPGLSRLAVLANPANPGTAPQLRAAETAARALGLRLQVIEARSAGELDRAFTTMTRERADALLVLVDAALANSAERLATLAARSRLPAMYGLPAHARAGGLIAYGAELGDVYRRAAIYVDKILKGARPGDLPVEQPTKFELVVNASAARALGVALPPSLLLQTSEVIE
jgi:putative ABC transport system substrate-binding protein